MFRFGKKKQAESRSPFARELAELAGQPWAIAPPAMTMLAHLVSDSVSEEFEREAQAGHWEREQQLNQMQTVGGVAYIPIRGMIVPNPCRMTDCFRATACSTIIENFNRALGNPEVEKIVFQISSPGGVCLGVEETSSLIYKARGQKPMLAINHGLMASAAYWIGSSADQVVASPSTSTGSIGAYWLHEDFSGWLAEIGIKISHLQYGEHKTDGSPFKPLDDKGRDSIQRWVDSSGEMFADAVARNRGVDRQYVLDNYGQGEIYRAALALEHGLIDHVAEPDVSILEFFEGTQMDNENEKSESTETNSEKTETSSNDQLTEVLGKLTNAVETVSGRLTGIESRIEVLEKTEEPSSEESKNDNSEETKIESNSDIDSIKASLDQMNAKIDHFTSSSSAAASGTDGETDDESMSLTQAMVAQSRRGKK